MSRRRVWIDCHGVTVRIGRTGWHWRPPGAWAPLSIRHSVPEGRFGRFYRTKEHP